MYTWINIVPVARGDWHALVPHERICACIRDLIVSIAFLYQRTDPIASWYYPATSSDPLSNFFNWLPIRYQLIVLYNLYLECDTGSGDGKWSVDIHFTRRIQMIIDTIGFGRYVGHRVSQIRQRLIAHSQRMESLWLNHLLFKYHQKEVK